VFLHGILERLLGLRHFPDTDLTVVATANNAEIAIGIENVSHRQSRHAALVDIVDGVLETTRFGAKRTNLAIIPAYNNV
jgi:hypothetical protein